MDVRVNDSQLAAVDWCKTYAILQKIMFHATYIFCRAIFHTRLTSSSSSRRLIQQAHVLGNPERVFPDSTRQAVFFPVRQADGALISASKTKTCHERGPLSTEQCMYFKIFSSEAHIRVSLEPVLSFFSCCWFPHARLVTRVW